MEARNIYFFVIVFPLANGAIPGSFFWKPRLGIDLSVPTTESIPIHVALPTRENIEEGLVVLIVPYQLGMSILALAVGISSAPSFPHLSPVSAYLHTNSYRWAMRYISMLPYWIGGDHVSLCDTHKVWRKRFQYMDEFVPKWMRTYLFPYVPKAEWEQEEKEMNRFKKYAEPSFGKFYRFPSKKFNYFKSQESHGTIENADASSVSLYS